MGKSKYRYDFEEFFERQLSYDIMDDQPSYDYAKAITSSVEDTQIIFCDSKAGTGKALRNGSKVQTPKGPIPIEKLKSKDEVFGSDGKVHSVTGVYPQGKKIIYEIFNCCNLSNLAVCALLVLPNLTNLFLSSFSIFSTISQIHDFLSSYMDLVSLSNYM